MTQVFDEKGNVVPVTVIEAGPCVVVQKKTAETDGYAAVQLGFGDVSPKRVNKPLKGHFDKADVAPKKTLREFRFDNCDAFNVGDIVKADTFAPGERVDVCGTSKGKGYAGAIKRWNFHRLKESHGTGPVARHAGSLGACSSPSRVFKGHEGRRPSRGRARDRSEPRRRQGGRGEQPHCGARRHSRPPAAVWYCSPNPSRRRKEGGNRNGNRFYI